ncbi:MAG: ABC transporter substrate-binding protein [Actinomycetota bacterium]
MRIRRGFVFGLVALSMIAAACGQETEQPGGITKEGPEITIGSAPFTESVLLAEIYSQGLEAKGYDTSTNLRIGQRPVYFPELVNGNIDLFPEYIGSLVSYKTQEEVTASSDTDEALAQLAGVLDDELVALEPSAAEDKDGIVANKETAEEFELQKVSDLQPHASELVFGAPENCPERRPCLGGLKDVYGIEFKEFRPISPEGPQTVDLLKANEIQVANLFTTNPQINVNGFVLLDDDQGISGSENIIPVVRKEIVDEYGDEFETDVNAISAKLTTEGLTELIKRVEVDQEDAEDVAADWLQANGLD